MENKQHLPIGVQLGGHYEIIEVLGEDNFEILYLVKDTHRLQALFVIKELFLNNISLRTQDNTIHTLEKSKHIFEETKKELIIEAQKLQKNNYKKDNIQTYGYFEENNTVYIIMEFINDMGLSSYLNVQPKKENKKIPSTVKEVYELKKEKPKSTIFLKVLLVSLLIFLGLGFYAYKMIEENKEKAKEKPTVVIKNTPLQHPELTNRADNHQKIESSTTINQKEENDKTVPNGAEYITEENANIKEKEIANGVPKDEIYINNEIEEIVETTPNIQNSVIESGVEETHVIVEENLPIQNPIEQLQVPYVSPTPSISLGTKMESPHVQNSRAISLGTPLHKSNLKKFNRTSIQNFLSTFIASSATGSVESIASHYDNSVDRYFSLRNVTHSKIKTDKRRYNRKWTHRNFKIIRFDIIKTYHQDETEYCDVKTKTKWSVSTDSGKYRSGISRGFMTIKSTDRGFKVKSIYTLK